MCYVASELQAKYKYVLAFLIHCIFMLMSEITQAGWLSHLPLVKPLQGLLITGGRSTSTITGLGVRRK